MNEESKRLAHALKLRFGTSPEEPNSEQLEKIKKELETIVQSGRRPSDEDWQKAVTHYCPSAGRHKYAGVDNSDLIALLVRAAKAR